jgi:hypothetical protein
MTRVDYDNLTDKRQEVLEASLDLFGTEDFVRSELNAVWSSGKTTTGLLNAIVEDGWLELVERGGGSAFVLDRNADEDKGDQVTGVTPSELSDLAHQVLDRNGISADLSHVDFGDWEQVTTEVNSLVSRQVLVVRSMPNRYRVHPDVVADLKAALS